MTRPLPPKIGPTEGGIGHAEPSGFCGLPGFEPSKLSVYAARPREFVGYNV